MTNQDSWSELSAKNLVKVEWVMDNEPYDMSYIDTWGCTEEELNKYRKEIEDSIRTRGVWCVVGYFRLLPSDPWQVGASVGQVIPTDADDSYTDDIAYETVLAYKEHLQKFRSFYNI